MSQKPGRGQRHPRQLLGIDDRNDENRADIINGGQREQKDAELRGNPFAEQGEPTERKGDIGRHRDSPSGTALPRPY